MPVKIIAEKSIPKDGLINQNDLKRIIQDFENFVSIESSISRQFKKINSISIPALLVKHLLEKAKGTTNSLEKVRINLKFGITLPSQKDCTDEIKDVSNHLTAVLIIERDKIEEDKVNDFVIVPGFKEFDSAITDDACCPVIHPGS